MKANKMKTKIILLMLIGLLSLNAQSILIIGGTATLNVSGTADICSDSLAGTVTGNGSFCGNPTDVESEISETIPTEFALRQNYPNPFNPSTTIQYQVSSVSYVTLKVYDVLGNEVATLVDELKSAGTYKFDFSVGRHSSPAIASGIYFYQLKAGEFLSIKKMTLLK